MTETIVMIHGMWCGGWYWENYKRFFEYKGYQCIAPTLRFHDMAPEELPNAELGITSLLDYVGDLEKQIYQLDALPILMGHSMGALLAQLLGSRGLAKALVAVGSCDSCVTGRNYRPAAIGHKKLLERSYNMGLLEKADTSDL